MSSETNIRIKFGTLEIGTRFWWRSNTRNDYVLFQKVNEWQAKIVNEDGEITENKVEFASNITVELD